LKVFNEKFKQLIEIARDKVETTPIPLDSVASNSDYPNENVSLLHQQKRDELESLQQEYNIDSSIIDERDKQIKDIQSQMLEVNAILKI